MGGAGWRRRLRARVLAPLTLFAPAPLQGRKFSGLSLGLAVAPRPMETRRPRPQSRRGPGGAGGPGGAAPGLPGWQGRPTACWRGRQSGSALIQVCCPLNFCPGRLHPLFWHQARHELSASDWGTCSRSTGLPAAPPIHCRSLPSTLCSGPYTRAMDPFVLYDLQQARVGACKHPTNNIGAGSSKADLIMPASLLLHFCSPPLCGTMLDTFTTTQRSISSREGDVWRRGMSASRQAGCTHSFPSDLPVPAADATTRWMLFIFLILRVGIARSVEVAARRNMQAVAWAASACFALTGLMSTDRPLSRPTPALSRPCTPSAQPRRALIGIRKLSQPLQGTMHWHVSRAGDIMGAAMEWKMDRQVARSVC